MKEPRYDDIYYEGLEALDAASYHDSWEYDDDPALDRMDPEDRFWQDRIVCKIDPDDVCTCPYWRELDKTISYSPQCPVHACMFRENKFQWPPDGDAEE